MQNKELEEYLSNHNGYITTKELVKIGYSKPTIPNLIRDKKIRKVSHGLYIDNKLIEDEFYIFQKRFSNTVFSYNTACYFLGLSERVPYKLEITTITHNNIRDDVDIHYVSKNKFEIGLIEIQSTYSNPIKIYNAERCICDLLKSKDSVDPELYNKIINNYFRSKDKNLSLLEDYARIFNVYEKYENIMEVLI